ncbi:metallophosphoesterase [Lignipirellula cremea]|uniref:Putative metallophosphoesterase n=1 Tax=Lignipirellula cremea TaxID=2528010 RepID=A0A518DS92_9BACT|nr:metallophosphoesterase [Lignipirellula cremea]QDU94712.1 putative metallophosphoesterase [Lignipirellula cremea]
MHLVDFLLLFLAFVGHVAIAVTIFNRLHAIGLPCSVVKLTEKLVILAAAVVLLLFSIYFLLQGFAVYQPAFASGRFWPPLLYLIPCWAASLCVAPLWIWRKLASRRPVSYLANTSRLVSLAVERPQSLVGTRSTGLLLKVPGNQIFQLSIEEKTFQPARLPAALDGFTIAHLSDLHMTGQLKRPFFDALIDRTNELDCDVVMVTGDIVEKAPCLDWIAPTLGRLQSRYGVYYVLGNHDQRLSDVGALHRLLADLGHIHVGGRCLEVDWRGAPVLLAGNELPWFKPAADMSDFPPSPEGPFRLLLSHSPDQFFWAQQQEFDLMLAGHTHGGQIRLPVYGPLIAPSRYGVMYASGVFQQGPTLMHVSRGVSGLQPIRLNCPPELTRITLRSPAV